MSKSYVTMEQAICVVCGNPYDTGSLLLDKRLKNRFEHKTVTHWGLCHEDQAKKDEGFIALVEAKNTDVQGTTMQKEEADRTGRICHIKQEAFERIFNVSVPKKGVAFVDMDVINQLQSFTGGDQ